MTDLNAMKMQERHRVEGTEPAIYIGRRVYQRRDGTSSVGRSWHAVYCVCGKQRSLSLRTRSRDFAIHAAHNLCQKLIEGAIPASQRRVPMRELKEVYLEMQANQNRSPKTLVKYRYILKEFCAWWEKLGDRPSSAFTERHFWAYRRFLEELGKTTQTIADRLILVKQLFKWGAGRGKMLRENPIADATVPEPPPTSQPCFTPDQVEKLLSSASDFERPIYTVLAYSGLRIGELVALRWQDVLLDRGQHGFLHVQRGGSNGTTKSKRSRLIPIHPKLRPIFESLPRNHENVFTRRPSRRYPRTNRPLYDRLLLTAVKRLCRKCDFAGWEKFKLHTFRHAFASMCARSHVSCKYALNWMGHKRSDILDMYITMYDEVQEQAMSTINYDRSKLSRDGGTEKVQLDFQCPQPS